MDETPETGAPAEAEKPKRGRPAKTPETGAPAAPIEAEAEPLPNALRLTSFHSFYDDDGVHWEWREGQIVTSAEQIQMLLDRAAPAEVVNE